MASRLWFSRRWRSWRAVWALFALEFLFTIPALALFAIAQPNLYRTRLWKDGYLNGFNSNPLAPVYAIVNGQTFETPVVWKQFITDYNVIISVLSMFLLLVKGVMFLMHLFRPILGVFIHGALTACWAYSVYAQTSPDNTDPRFPKLGAPWYIVKGCGVAKDKNLVPYCRQAKAQLAVTVIMLFLFAANTALALFSTIPTRAERLAYRTSLESAHDSNSAYQKFDAPPMSAKSRAWSKHESKYDKSNERRPSSHGVNESRSSGMQETGGYFGGHGGQYQGGNWEQAGVPPTPGTAAALLTPATPRTMAFQRLGGSGSGSGSGSGARGRDLPLRSQ